jgi:voltage-gated potassium channel
MATGDNTSMNDSTPDMPNAPAAPPWRRRMYRVIFLADTPSGKLFDILLIAAIVASIAVVMLNSVQRVNDQIGSWLYAAEWGFTVLFSVEYICRLICSGRPARYARSFFGITDLLSTLPTFLSLIFPGMHGLLSIRALRVLRVFRVLNITSYMNEAKQLGAALMASRRKIVVFLLTVLMIVVILGSLMYAVEGRTNGFTSIPRSVYWAIVTLTTVGYGDISPSTPMGQAIAAVVMILGYSIIAICTGIVGLEVVRERAQAEPTTCPHCRKTF